MKKRNSLIYTLAKPAEKFYNKVNPSYSACPRAGINLGGNSMLYKKNIEKELDKGLFQNPTSEYRGTPFWAWNCKLNSDMLREQIDMLQQMGFGGFHMHVRTGMATTYLSDEFFELISDCVEKAKENHMLAWLYDEDRWPSGAAGGIITRDPQYRARHLLFTPCPYGDEYKGYQKELVGVGRLPSERTKNGSLLACYDIVLDKDGYLLSGKRISPDSEAEGKKWYAYVELATPSEWYNNQTYLNTLDKKAVDRFIEVTHESYLKKVGTDFGEAVPAIFTDEPQFTGKATLRFGLEERDITLPWTDDLPETFQEAYSEDLVDSLPELIWDLPDSRVSTVRYHYHDHVTERFVEAFADSCGNWCFNHNIALTGHVMAESTLGSQTSMVGEAMRCYRKFGLPGIDMLCDWREYTTAKQAQSAVHQYGREGMTSELYGVTNWDFDFRGHKLQGDWQAALGVTVRVPHLSWVSMGGEAKRDYPASINYQSPWYQEYSYIEDHFARLNTALTRGTPIVKVGVIHPIESYWLHWGPSEQTALDREQLDNNFQDLTKWLLFGAIDFDFIAESLLPEQCGEGGAPLRVGKMAYDAIVVPGCETLRSSTLDRLEAFRKAGGKLIFMGDAPKYENAVPSSRGKKLFDSSIQVSFGRSSILKALDDCRTIDIRNEKGNYTEDLFYQMRQDGDKKWLFIAHASLPKPRETAAAQNIIINIRGEYAPTLYDTLTGEISSIPYSHQNGNTHISTTVYCHDSLLLQLAPSNAKAPELSNCDISSSSQLKLPAMVPYTLSEPNVYMLDMAEYSLDGEEFNEEEEILRLDNKCKQRLGWPQNSVTQPWAIPEEPYQHTVTLRYTIESEIQYEGASLALEHGGEAEISWNGEKVSNQSSGWYVDKNAIQKVALPEIKKGTNILTITWPFSKRINLEWCYLLGDFGVRVCGRKKWIVPAAKELAFSDVVSQGLPFYGGNITYHIDFEGEGDFTLTSSAYHGALLNVSLDGKPTGRIVFSPYQLTLKNVKPGRHRLDITLFGTRVNTFGQVHLILPNYTGYWFGPNAWRTKDYEWSYEYQLRSVGLLSSPTLCKNK